MEEITRTSPARHWIGFGLGILLFFLMLLLPSPGGMSPATQKVAAVTLLMICWWISEAIPIPATALVPLALYPLLGVMDGKTVAAPYADENIFLFLGGFCIAMAMQKWNLHRRIALHIVKLVGEKPRQLVLGFMVATAFVSMWISNTATTMMMFPIGLAMITRFTGQPIEQSRKTNFGIALMLGIGYSASIGGLGTLIGTPPNLVFAGQVKVLYPDAPEVGFFQWMQVGVPLVVLFLPLAWFYLTFIAFPPESRESGKGMEVIDQELTSLGRFSTGEKYTLIVFIMTCFAWIFRKSIHLGVVTIPGWADLLGLGNVVEDSTISIAAALLLFALPVDLKRRAFVLDWETAVKLPWGILILFGGGFALAKGFVVSGLSGWIGSQVVMLSGLPLLWMIVGICLLVMALTEVTSNTATATMMLPVLASVSGTLGIHPFALMIPATISASCAFMLPVSTPPNAIVFGSGQISIPTMAKTGLALNLIGVVLITLLMYLIAGSVFGINFSQTPAWLK